MLSPFLLTSAVPAIAPALLDGLNLDPEWKAKVCVFAQLKTR